MLNSLISRIKDFVYREKNLEKKYYTLPLERRKEKIKYVPEIIRFNESTLAYYRKNVRGNTEISSEQANLKITRSKELAFVYKQDNKTKKNPRTWYAYGSLRFMVSGGEVKWIKNHCKVFPMWQDSIATIEEKYYKLSKQLGIDNDHIK